MSVLDVLLLIAGLFGVAIFLFDLFNAVVVPRQTFNPLRVGSRLVRWSWIWWRELCLRFSPGDRREELLAAFAPVAMVGLLFVWMGGLIVCYGIAFYALRANYNPIIASFGDAVYLSASSMLTIGFGDIVVTGAFARVLAMASAASGLAVVAVVISFLFQTFAAFQRREVFVVTLGQRAGAPPSGVTLLETAMKLDLVDDLMATLRSGQIWSNEVLESHLAYPILIFFRSSHDDESWVGALGALLDASTLLLTVTDGLPKGQATLMLATGHHLVNDLGRYFASGDDDDPGLERFEFDQACERLKSAGAHVQTGDDSWLAFKKIRAKYAAPLNAMAKSLAIPPTLWIGDRSPLRRH
ncbi:MAG TPA: potassium channel family protein [Candidatus Tumulicola sp.]|nr:potassium channel family protein [Candidatus Tumulicola sp.]